MGILSFTNCVDHETCRFVKDICLCFQDYYWVTWSCRQRGVTYKQNSLPVPLSGLFVQSCVSNIRILIQLVKENTAYGGGGGNSGDLVLVS